MASGSLGAQKSGRQQTTALQPHPGPCPSPCVSWVSQKLFCLRRKQEGDRREHPFALGVKLKSC